jgi:hypothetical protein
MSVAEQTTDYRRVELLRFILAGLHDKESHHAVATHPDLAGAYMTQAVRSFNEQLERIAELVIVLVTGAMLALYCAPTE